MRFIGVTGGIGAGKSQILSFISANYNCEIYLADKVAFEVRKPGTKTYQELVSLMGEEVVNDSTKMAQAIYADPSLLDRVNNIIHPAVKDYLLDAYDRAKKINKIDFFFVEAALLIECGYGAYVDEMWYIYASEEIRIERLMNSRGYSRDKACSIISKQLSDDEFRKNSDFIIDNSKDLEYSYSQIRTRLEDILCQK